MTKQEVLEVVGVVACTVCGRKIAGAWINPWACLDYVVCATIEGVFCSKGCLYEFLLNGTTHKTSNDATPRRGAVERADGLQEIAAGREGARAKSPS